jgi:hypothetical protein
MDTDYERETKEIEAMKDHCPLSCDVMSVDRYQRFGGTCCPSQSG